MARRARREPDWTPEIRVVSGAKITVAVRNWKRAVKGRRLHELAHSLGVSERMLSYWRTRKDVDMGANMLLRLAAALGVPVEDLTDPV